MSGVDLRLLQPVFATGPTVYEASGCQLRTLLSTTSKGEDPQRKGFSQVEQWSLGFNTLFCFSKTSIAIFSHTVDRLEFTKCTFRVLLNA